MTMENIIERLRFGCPFKAGTLGEKDAEAAEGVMAEAADEIERLREALTELVELKDMKARIENHHTLPFHEARRIPEMKADYERRKPLAWQAARALVPNG
jgi:hypothetical protein